VDNGTQGLYADRVLVVIAIIAILAAILFPVFARAREKARQAACLSNVKQIGLGIMMYAEDYDEVLPGYQQSPVFWWDILQPYLKNRQILVCPDKLDWNYNDPTNKSGYGLNEDIFTADAAAKVSLAAIQAPSETIGAADKDQGNARCIGNSFKASVTWPYNVGTRHNDGANFLFMDGHAKWMGRGASWSTSDEMWDTN